MSNSMLLTQQGFCRSWATCAPLCSVRVCPSPRPAGATQHWMNYFLQMRRRSCGSVEVPGDLGAADHASQAAQEAGMASVCPFSVQQLSLRKHGESTL